MSNPVSRRSFLGTAVSTSLAVGLAAQSSRTRGADAADKLVVGVMGTGGRGTSVSGGFQRLSNVDVAYVCDVDAARAERAAESIRQIKGSAPQVVDDFRRILDDKAVDVLLVTCCNHWHAPGAILGCSAGKHVYVEKPCSHTPQEGEWLVAAARKNKRLVQMGNQRRSWPRYHEAVERLKAGVIGRVYFARCAYNNNRPSIGIGKEGPAPEGLNYELWQGPSTRKPFKDNYLHYNWHWFWHWGNGELGNNGVHMIDLCRWGLGVDYPTRVSSSGGRYHFQDDQETPDTHVVAYEFADRKQITWTGLSCNRQRPDQGVEVVFVGEEGTLLLEGGGYTVLDAQGKQIDKVMGTTGDHLHFGNFVDAIRNGTPLNSEIEQGHQSTLLCHLGNIAHRTGRALKCDPLNGHILEDAEAQKLWTKEYAPGFEPKV